MRLTRKVLLVLVMLIAFCIAACGKKKEEKQEAPAPQPVEEQYVPDFDPIPAPYPNIGIESQHVEQPVRRKKRRAPQQETGHNGHPFPKPIGTPLK